MILIDDRIGANDLEQYITPKSSVQLVRLDFGDIAFTGHGPQNSVRRVGIERKRLNDILDCIITGRFSGHQLIGLIDHYDDYYLVIEDRFREHPDTGVLQTWKWSATLKRLTWVDAGGGKRRWMYKELDHYLMTMQLMVGVKIWRTESAIETARWVMDMYSWWNDKKWEEHTSHLQFDESDKPTMYRPSLVTRICAQFDGVGYTKAVNVTQVFKTVWELVHATEKEWTKVDGIGKTLSKRIVAAIRGE